MRLLADKKPHYQPAASLQHLGADTHRAHCQRGLPYISTLLQDILRDMNCELGLTVSACSAEAPTA